MIITIARQCGCGALHIGEQLSQHYGIPFYTRKNLLELAQKRGVLQEMDDFFEERPVDELMFAISQFTKIASSLAAVATSSSKIVKTSSRCFSKAVSTAA